MRSLIITFLISSLIGCTSLNLRKDWDIKDMVVEEPSDSLKKLLDYSKHPFISFIAKQDQAYDSCGKNLNCIFDYVDAGINLSDKLCADWFKQNLRKDTELNQKQGMMNVVGDGALALASLAKVSTDAMGYFSILLGGTNNGFEIYKQNNTLVEDTLYLLENKVRKGRTIAASNLLKNSKTYSFLTAQRKIREYHNTCSRIQLISYISKSVELVEYRPKLQNLKINADVVNASKIAYKAIYNSEGSFNSSDLKLLYFYVFGNEQVKIKVKENPYISIVISKMEEDPKRKDVAIEAIHNVGNLLDFNDQLTSFRDNLIDINSKQQQISLISKKGITDKVTIEKLNNDLFILENSNILNSTIELPISLDVFKED